MKGNEANICFDLLVHRAVDLQIRSLKWDGKASPCIMVHIFGHVGSLDVEFHRAGWQPGQTPTVSMSCEEKSNKGYSMMKDTLDYIESELDKWEAEHERRIC